MEPLMFSLLDQATSFFLHEQVHTSILIILTRNLNIFSRFYIEAKLHTDLKTELVKLLSSLEADKHVSLMSAAQSRPFSVPPATMASLCKHLATLNPEYTAIQPQLFSSYLYNCPEWEVSKEGTINPVQLLKYLKSFVFSQLKSKRLLSIPKTTQHCNKIPFLTSGIKKRFEEIIKNLHDYI